MDRRVFRVCRSLYARLDGEGAKRVGGRWNPPGRAVVYMAESISLAVIENLVHMSKEDFPVGYVSASALIPSELRVLTEHELRKEVPNMGQREMGDYWIDSEASAVLRVPSVVVPDESNFLLNPRHAGFAHIIVEPPKPFVFDPRLFTYK
jgi:RES domain-containing protein